MPSRPDIRELAANVKDAFSEMDRETLLEILTFVVKEYVAEGPPPMLLHQAETLSDLKGASFAQLIGMMQTRFDFPELQMFVVDGEQVGVRINGAIQPLLPSRSQAAEPGPAAVPGARAPQPGVRVVETGLGQRPPVGVQLPPGVQMPANAQVVDTRQAPPPTRGLSVRGAPTGGGSPPPRPEPAAQPPAPAAPAPAASATPPPAAPSEDKKPEGGDDASARFSLLELD